MTDALLLNAFRTILKDSSDMIFVKNRDLVYLAASDSFLQMIGLTASDMIVGKTDWDIFPPELAEKYIKDDKELLASGNRILDYLEPLPSDGSRMRTSSTSKYPVYNEKGAIAGLYGIARDVTEQMELQSECESSRFSRQILFDGVIEADITNDKILKIIGKSLGEFESAAPTKFSYFIRRFAQAHVHHNHSADFLRYYDVKKLHGYFSAAAPDFRHVASAALDGSYKWYEFLTTVYESQVSGSLCITIFIKNIDEEMQHRQKLQNKAQTDSLTGLLNRESIFNTIGEELAHATAASSFALLFIDLDNFKQVNDRFGHLYGDKVLQQAAAFFRDCFDGKALCGRIGGDEFLLFVRDAASKNAVAKQLQKIVADFKALNAKNSVTCSIGVVLCANETQNVGLLYKQADQAMYLAKKAGKNQWSFLQPTENTARA